MATLLKSGVPILQAMGIVQSIMINRVIADSVTNLRQALKRGKGLSGPLEEAGIFPPMAVHMITVGETSGSLDEMLTKVSKTYDKEVEQSIKQVISLIEPMMILLLGFVIYLLTFWIRQYLLFSNLIQFHAYGRIIYTLTFLVLVIILTFYIRLIMEWGGCGIIYKVTQLWRMILY